MVLAVHSNESYLTETQARSRAGGHFFLSTIDNFPQNNGVILNTVQIMKAVISSTAEAELGALFINMKQAMLMQQTLHELGHLQPLMPVQTDNSMTFGMVMNKIIPKATKGMNMGYH